MGLEREAVNGEEIEVAAVEVVEVPEEAETRARRRNGSRSQSWVVWSRLAK